MSALFVALMLGVWFAIFLATPLDPVEHMGNSLDRLLFQLWPSIIYATAVSLWRGGVPGAAAPLPPVPDRA